MNYCKEWLTFCYLWPVECHWWEDEASTRLVNWSGGFGWQCRSVNVVDSCVVIVLPTTVAEIRHFSRPDVTALYIRRPCLPSHCGTSLECSACGRYIYIYTYMSTTLPGSKRLLVTELFSRSFPEVPAAQDCVITEWTFRRDACNVVSQLQL